ncbi:MAG TPA: tetratricopeptide repeat protein, partial [Novosphingobium sp.]|nr:tetratricopeptide repeat protein [Novosphingobium sp.]
MTIRHTLAMAAGCSLLALAAPALADVKRGVDAWAEGDYATAVREWREPATRGDPDAQFNMAQAYRLGRGGEANQNQAEVLYAKAAAQGHIKAADNYGLLLFQDGRREEAMPYVTAAAQRGDPRAQYLLGIAHFNGDLVEKDWVRAYALLTLANGAQLPQAAPALQQMDSYIPLGQREQAQVLARQLKQDSDARRMSQLTAVDLALGREAGDAAPVAPRTAAVAASRPALPAREAGRIPQPIPTVPVAPSIAAAQAAIAEAERVTGTESPASSGADFARSATQPRVAGAA